MVLLQWLADGPAARQQLTRRFGEPAVQSAESLERDLNLGAWVDDVFVVTPCAVGDGAEQGLGESAVLK